VDEFGARVHAVGDDQWGAPTPDAEWDVRTLVNHLVNEDRWAPPLLEGATIAEVGDRFEGDLLGDDAEAAWAEASAAAVAAARADGALGRTVHLSFGDFPGEFYLSQLVCDHVIHAWDLARGIGGDEALDHELVEWVHGFLAPQVDGWRAAGVFGPPVETPADADLQTKLLGLTGRRV
jgi:uncharacterized protein (TIGR03086 family)